MNHYLKFQLSNCLYPYLVTCSYKYASSTTAPTSAVAAPIAFAY